MPAVDPPGVPENAFVAGELHIPREQGVQQPRERIEPMQREREEEQRLQYIIPPPYMRALVQQHVRAAFPAQFAGT